MVTQETKTVTIGRRGIGTARGVARKKFSHEDANRKNGLFIGHLEDVNVSMIKIGEETKGMPSFNGMEIPRIAFTFASNEENPTARKYTTLSFTAVESNVDTIPGGSKVWTVDSIFNWFKHIHETYFKGRELTDEEVAALTLPFEDYDEEGHYVSVEPEVVANGWKSVFEGFANIMNTGRDGNPIYNTSDGKFITIWMKMLRCTKSKKGWTNINNGALVLPTFIGEGCIELYKQNVAPSIRIDAIRESIIPQVKEVAPKAPTVMPEMGGVSPYGGGAVDTIMDGEFVDGMGDSFENRPF